MATKVTEGQSRARIRLRRRGVAGASSLWEGRFTYVDAASASGRRWVSVYGESRARVEAKLVDAMAQRQKGIDPPRGTLTVGAYLDRWLEQTEHDLKRSTAVRYRQLVDFHVSPRIGHVKLNQLSPADINRMTAAIVAAGRSPHTANRVRAVVRTALNDAIREGLLARNAAALADPRRVDERSIDPMAPNEARRILDAVAEHPVGPLVATALWTGLRQGELLALTWDRVDLDARTLRVSGSVARIAGETLMWAPKNRSSVRVVPIAAPLVPILATHRVRQRQRRLSAGSDWETSWGDLVFTTAVGDPLNGTTVSGHFKGCLHAAGLPRRRFHDLRHGAATLWLAAGVDLKTVSTLLGHSTIATTANVYTGVLDSLRRDAVDRMARLLSPGSESLLLHDP
jgi:integrase